MHESSERKQKSEWFLKVYVLDTDVLIDVQRGYRPALDWFVDLTDPVSIPGFVVMELIQNARNKLEVQQALKLTEPFDIVWPSEQDCNRALENFQQFHLSHGLGLLDALIAVCAIGQNAILCTFNTKHYRFIPNLQLLGPYEKQDIVT